MNQKILQVSIIFLATNRSEKMHCVFDWRESVPFLLGKLIVSVFFLNSFTPFNPTSDISLYHFITSHISYYSLIIPFHIFVFFYVYYFTIIFLYNHFNLFFFSLCIFIVCFPTTHFIFHRMYIFHHHMHLFSVFYF